MIDHTYRCIFIHQRKVAGTSIKLAFDKTRSMPDWHTYNGGVLGQAWANRKSPEDTYFVFSAVRNPFDRVISAWKYLPKLSALPLEHVLKNLPLEGEEYRHFTMSQLAMIRDPRTMKLVVNDLIRYESLQADFDRICNRIGKPRRALAVVNAGPRSREYRKYFTAKTRALTAAIFKEDLEYFRYEF